MYTSQVCISQVIRTALTIMVMSNMAFSGQLEEVAGWLKLPADWRLRGASGIAVDSKGRVYIAHRGEHPLFVVDRDGNLLRTIAEEHFPATNMILPTGKPARPEPMHWLHGLWLDRQDNIWVTEIGRDVVLKFSPEGRLLLTLGTSGRSGEGPNLFHQPTGVGIGPNGDVYISDGYGNSRVARFSSTGKYKSAWGRKGSKPGEFDLPHGITVGPDGKVYVAERLNNRVQIFDRDGRFLAQWSDLPGADAIRLTPDGHAYVGSADNTRTFQRLSVDGTHREVLATRAEMGYPHTFCFDQEGNLYVADPLEHTVRKFRLKRVKG